MVTWLSLILGLLPAAIWMAFFLIEDRKKPEPKGMILSTFVMGALATFVVLQLQIYFRQVIGPLGVKEFSPFSIFWFAGIEEVMKFLVVFLWVSKRKVFNEPIDAMIYMIIAALGFATLENVVSVSKSAAGFELISLRFIGATLVHALSSALVGFYWARAIIRKSGSWSGILWGLLIATLVHTIFNSLVIVYGPSFWVTAFLAFVAFFVLADFEKLKRNPTPKQQSQPSSNRSR